MPSPQLIEATKLSARTPGSLSVNVATTTSVSGRLTVALTVKAVPTGVVAGLVTLIVWILV